MPESLAENVTRGSGSNSGGSCKSETKAALGNGASYVVRMGCDTSSRSSGRFKHVSLVLANTGDFFDIGQLVREGKDDETATSDP